MAVSLCVKEIQQQGQQLKRVNENGRCPLVHCPRCAFHEDSRFLQWWRRAVLLDTACASARHNAVTHSCLCATEACVCVCVNVVRRSGSHTYPPRPHPTPSHPTPHFPTPVVITPPKPMLSPPHPYPRPPQLALRHDLASTLTPTLHARVALP